MEIVQATGREGYNERLFRDINVIKDRYLSLLHGVPRFAVNILNNGSQIEQCSSEKRRFLGRGQMSTETDVTFHS